MHPFAVEPGQHSIRVSTVHCAHVCTPLLMNEPTCKLFRSDLENPGPDDLAPICQSFHVLPIPWVEPWTSATRCCSWHPTKPGTSPA
jgi:(+)-trans-carveol dehydrogenase